MKRLEVWEVCVLCDRGCAETQTMVLQAGITAYVNRRERVRDILDSVCRTRYLMGLFFVVMSTDRPIEDS